MEIQSWTPKLPPIEVFFSLSQESYSFFFHHEKQILMGFNPFLIFKSKGSHVEIIKRNGEIKTFSSSDPLKELSKLYQSYASGFSETPFFQGGLIGYIGYDFARKLERTPHPSKDDQNFPDIVMGFYDCAYLYNSFETKGNIIAIALPGENQKDVQSKILELKKNLEISSAKKIDVAGDTRRRALPSATFSEHGGAVKWQDPLRFNWKSNFDKKNYLETIRKAKDYIAKGDIYQVNLSQRFTSEYHGDSFNLFQKLLIQNPAPHAAYFRTPDATLLSLSPERFLKIKNKFIQTSPIKGTRPRGQTPQQDKNLKEELLCSSKDAAELLMIIDLERNDLGRVCEYGSIHVSDLKRIETHPTVFHLAGDISGTLKEGLDVFDVLKATFPGGSITGAPKIRSMQIIEELEPTRRNIYTGTFGVIGFNAMTDLSILIRTLIHHEGTLSFQVGSGIVWDSDPQAEYEETLVKGKIFLEL